VFVADLTDDLVQELVFSLLVILDDELLMLGKRQNLDLLRLWQLERSLWWCWYYLR